MKNSASSPASPISRNNRLISGSIALAVAAALALSNSAQAANTTFTTTSTSGNWSAATWSTPISGIGAGDLAQFNTAATAATLTLNTAATLGQLQLGTAATNTWAISASGSIAFTLDGTGITVGNQIFGNAGIAAIGSRGTGANLTINPNIVLANTDLDMGNTQTGTLTIGGTITATTAQNLNFRGSGTGVVTVNGNIGASGSNIALSNLRGSGGNVTIAGVLGSSVSSVTENSSASNLILTGVNTSFAGPVTLTAGTLQGSSAATATNVMTAFGTGQINLNGGTLQLRGNGTGNNQTIITGNGTTGNNVVVGGDVTINVDRNASSSGNTFQFNNLSIGANTLTVTNGSSYGLQFAGTTTLTGNASINTNGGITTLTGAVSGVGFSLSKVTSGNTLVLSSASNSYTGGTIVSAGLLNYNGTATSGTPFSTGSITLNGAGAATSTQTTLSITPSATGTTTLTGGTIAGSQLSFSNTAFINLVRKDSSSPLSYTFGPGSGSVLNRVGRGVLVIMDNTSGIPSALGISGGNNLIINGTAPTITNGMVAAYYIGGRSGGSGQATFLTYDNTFGFTNATYDLSNTFTGSDNTKKVTFNGSSTLAADAAAYAVQITSATTLNPGVTLSIGDNGTTPAGLILSNAGISGGTIAFGASEGIIYAGGSQTIGSAITGSGGITKSQYNGTNGVLTLTGLNTYSGTTTVTAGTIAYNNVGNQTYGDLDGLGTVANALDSGTLGFTQAASTTYNIGTVTNNTTTGATGAFTLDAGLNSVTTIGTVNGASGSVVNFSGNGTGSTTITNPLNTTGQTVNFNAGTINLDGNGSYGSTLVVNGATVNTLNNAANTANFRDVVALQVLGGTFNVQSGSALRIGNNSGTNNSGSGVSATALQSGGTINFTNNATLQLGSAGTTAFTDTFALSGGVFSSLNTAANSGISIGAGTTGGGTSSFNFSGGTLRVGGTISGRQSTGAQQSFVWTGGTLAVGTFNATNLTSTQGMAVSASTNTLTNGGGILAPGDIGTAGRTVITGNYNANNANAVLAIDLGGTAAATAFQGTAAQYDNLSFTGATTLGGRLNFDLTNSYAPLAATNHNIIVGTTAGATGNFTNEVVATSGNIRVVGADGLSSFLIATNTGSSAATVGGLTAVGARTTALGNYQATNTYNAASGGTWNAANAASWTNFDPGSSTGASGAIAQFADGANTGAGTNTVTLNGTRNIQGVQFSSATAGHNYTISGSGALVLDNTSNNAASTITDSSASGNVNAINNVPITLNSNLVVSVTNASNTLAVGSAISGTGRSLTKTGLGTLTLSGANAYTGSTTVSSGTLLLGNNSAITTATANSAPSGSAVTLSGGNIGFVGDISEGNTTTTGVGALTLSATSSIDFGAGVDLIHFAASGSQTWTGTLNIFNWTQGSDRLLFGTADSSTSLTAGQLSQISFYSGANTLSSFLGNGAFTGTGNGDLTFTAVPEPSTYIGGGLILGLAAWSQRKRWNQLKVS